MLSQPLVPRQETFALSGGPTAIQIADYERPLDGRPESSDLPFCIRTGSAASLWVYLRSAPEPRRFVRASDSTLVFDRLLGGPPLVPNRLRRSVLVLFLVTIACLSGFGFATRNSSRPLLFDSSADAFLRRTSGIQNRLAGLLSEVGHPKVFVTITALVALALILLGDNRAATATVMSVVFAVFLVEEVLKPFFDRRLGSLPGPVFPSGHTAVSVALAGAVTLAAGADRPLAHLVRPAFRHLLVAIVLVASCAIGVAMVALQFHYTSDVVAAVPLGLSVSGFTALFLDALAARCQKSMTLTPRKQQGRSGQQFPANQTQEDSAKITRRLS